MEIKYLCCHQKHLKKKKKFRLKNNTDKKGKSRNGRVLGTIEVKGAIPFKRFNTTRRAFWVPDRAGNDKRWLKCQSAYA